VAQRFSIDDVRLLQLAHKRALDVLTLEWDS